MYNVDREEFGPIHIETAEEIRERKEFAHRGGTSQVKREGHNDMVHKR